MVLIQLNETSHTGYSLMNGLKESLGKKPSAGSIYPLLTNLLENGFVSIEEDGRKKIYSITKKGRSALDDLSKEKELHMKRSADYMIKNNLATEAEFSEVKDKLNCTGKCLLPKLKLKFAAMHVQFMDMINDPELKSCEGELIKISTNAMKSMKDVAKKCKLKNKLSSKIKSKKSQNNYQQILM